MVNTGRPSMGCAICKTRKIKCDLRQPACSQCLKSGWACPRPPSRAITAFCHRPRRMIRTSEQANLSHSGLPWLSGAAGRIRDLLPSIADRATAFFTTKYVFGGIHNYIPALLKQESSSDILSTIVSAMGLAALANTGSSSSWRSEAYRLYGNALHRLQLDLRDPNQIASDGTLAAVMLTGTFESIVCADPTSAESISYYIIAAERCIEMRERTRFDNELSTVLFSQLRRLIVLAYYDQQSQLPHAFKAWLDRAEPPQTNEASPLIVFANILESIVSTRTNIKKKAISDPLTVATMLYPIDALLEKWRTNLPDSWNVKSYRCLGVDVGLTSSYKSQYDTYPNIHVAAGWNNYRMLRIMIHEFIINTMKQDNTTEHAKLLRFSVQVLAEMADSICFSVPYTLGSQYIRSQEGDATTLNDMDGTQHLGAGYLLAWPLFIAGSLKTTGNEQRKWITLILHKISLGIGLQMARSMAIKLKHEI